MFHESTQHETSPRRKAGRGRLWRTLRVRLTYSGARIIEQRTAPRELVGQVIPWERFAENPLGLSTRFVDEHGESMRIEGRRWFLRIDDTRMQATARRLINRWIDRSWREGIPIEEVFHRESRCGRVIMWPLAVMWLVVSIYAFGIPIWQGWQGAAGGPLVMQALTLIVAFLMFTLVVGLAAAIIWMAYESDRPRAARCVANRDGIIITQHDSREDALLWTDIREIHAGQFGWRITTKLGTTIHLPRGRIIGRVLEKMRDESRDASHRSERASARRMSLDMVVRLTKWCAGGAVIVGLVAVWLHFQGLTQPLYPWANSPLLFALASSAQLLVIPMFGWVLYFIHQPWVRRRARTVWRGIRR